ncbi:hypothetical protein F5146DRAFT_1038736 [Armillaria mellea]|nr:hypothetical protein F5146DRAFT_1038736 [Armillaria mellea]
MYREFLGTLPVRAATQHVFQVIPGCGNALGWNTCESETLLSPANHSKHSRPRFNRSREPTNSSTFHKAKLSPNCVILVVVTSLYCFHRPRNHGICAGKVTAIHSHQPRSFYLRQKKPLFPSTPIQLLGRQNFMKVRSSTEQRRKQLLYLDPRNSSCNRSRFSGDSRERSAWSPTEQHGHPANAEFKFFHR